MTISFLINNNFLNSVLASWSAFRRQMLSDDSLVFLILITLGIRGLTLDELDVVLATRPLGAFFVPPPPNPEGCT